MTPNQIWLVEESFGMLLPISDSVAAKFYANLFAQDAEIAEMFSSSDLTRQGEKLMTALTMVVNGLRQPENILSPVGALGARHREYGVKDEQYQVVGSALIQTLEAGLGSAFTSEIRDAWIAAYTLLSGVMIAAGSREVAVQ